MRASASRVARAVLAAWDGDCDRVCDGAVDGVALGRAHNDLRDTVLAAMRELGARLQAHVTQLPCAAGRWWLTVWSTGRA